VPRSKSWRETREPRMPFSSIPVVPATSTRPVAHLYDDDGE
jgi:hypothetical protein